MLITSFFIIKNEGDMLVEKGGLTGEAANAGCLVMLKGSKLILDF